MPVAAPAAPHFLQVYQADGAAIRAELAAGLLADPPHAAPKFFYDALGSRLFDAITELEEYDLPRQERDILDRHLVAIAGAVLGQTGAHPILVDLGAGNCAKAARLFPALSPARYVAVDISTDFLKHSMHCLQREHPALPMIGVATDFSQRLDLPGELVEGPALVFYPGSSIGNFAPGEAVRLLNEARLLSRGGGLLVGVDLVKPTRQLESAYDDDLGVTAAFNLNLLKRLNRLLGANFDVRHWRHVALFNASDSRIEMHLEARIDVEVRWPGGHRRFGAGERIHTENSYKWTAPDFDAMLRSAGWGRVQSWRSASDGFAIFLAC